MATAIRFLLVILGFQLMSGGVAKAQAQADWERGLYVYDASSNRAGVIGTNLSSDGRVAVKFEDPVKHIANSQSYHVSTLLKEAPSIKAKVCGEEFEVKKGLSFVGKENGLYEIKAVFPNGKIEVVRENTAKHYSMKDEPPAGRIDFGIVDASFIREIELQCNHFCPAQSVVYPNDGRLRDSNYVGDLNGRPLEYKVTKTFCGGSIALKNPNVEKAPPALVNQKGLYAYHPGLSPTAIGRKKKDALKDTQGTP